MSSLPHDRPDSQGTNRNETVLRDRRGGVVILTLNRPDRLNAWNDRLEDRYFELLDEADADPDVRAVVITGAGPAFCAGADIHELHGIVSAGDASEILQRSHPRNYPLRFRKPLIAAINGAAAGLGFVEAMYCDIRFCTPNSKLTTAFVRRGLIAEYGLSWILPRMVGVGHALDLLMSGRVVLGEEAYRMGLVDRLVSGDELVDAAVAYGKDLAQNCSPRSMAIIKAQVYRHLATSEEDAIGESDRLMLEALDSDDAAEGITSFIERRPPKFPALARRP